MGPESESESDRWLSTAEKLLAASDLLGSRRFAERALESDPLSPSDRADRLIAVADVLLASRASARPNPYSILSSPPRSRPSAVLSSYRRLSLLLNPSSNHLPFAAHASDLVSYAYSVLSDPGRRSAFDSDATTAGGAMGFWTSCPSCCHVYLYDRVHVGAELLCQQCGKGFRADELAAAPPVVEGTDMYYCTWGYFPLGPNGPQQPAPPPAEAPAAAMEPAKGVAGKKRNAGAGGIDINREIDDDDDDDDVVELTMD